MGGTFFHSKDFAIEEYVGDDGRPHFEVLPVDGEAINLSHSSWREMKELAEAHGMPRSAWPEFLEYDFGIDVPLEQVHAKQDCFRSNLLRLSPSVLERHFWLEQVAEWVNRGETVFFCGN